MRKSCISLVLSGVVGLCGASEDTITANFGNKNSGGGSGGTWTKAEKPNAIQFQQPQSNNDAKYGVDWTGSETNLSLNTSGLTFTFSSGGVSQLNLSSTPSKLLFKDGFKFYNHTGNLAQITIQWNETGSLQRNTTGSLIFGEGKTGIVLDKKIALKLQGFKDVKMNTIFSLAEGVSFDTNGADLNNISGIILQKDNTLTTKTLTNDGTIVLGSNSTIKANKIDGTNNKGKIDVQGNSTIILNGNGASGLALTGANGSGIKGQTITISKDKVLTITNQESLASKPSVSIMSNNTKLALESVVFKGDLTSADPSVVIKGFTSLESKDVTLSSIAIRAESVATLTNTKMTFKGGHLILGGTNGAEITEGTTAILAEGTSKSTFEVYGKNNVITAGNQALTIKGSHTFSGGGALDIVGKTITLGESSMVALIGADQKTSELTGKDNTSLSLHATDSVITQNLKVTNLNLNVLSDNTQAKVKNSKLELGDGAYLKAINRKDELIDLVIEKNGTSSNAIEISNQGNATIQAKNLTITDNNITLNNSNNVKTSLTLIAKEGTITLGNGSSDSPMKIEGKNDLENNLLDLQTSGVVFGKKVELNKLSITAGGENGVTFYGTQGGEITFKGGTTITTKRDEAYTEMNFSTQFAGQNGGGKNKLIFEGDTKLKASNITLQNQEVKLGMASSVQSTASVASAAGTTLSLYALGADGRADNGAFSIVNSTFSSNNGQTNGTHGEVALYTNKGAVLLADGLVLDGVDLKSYDASIIHPTEPETPSKSFNSLDLSASTGNLQATGNVTIQANGIYTSGKEEGERVQGIGMDIYVGSSEKIGNLKIKSEEKADTFVIGGELVIDNSKANGAVSPLQKQNQQSSIEIELGTNGNGGVAKLSDQTLSLQIDGGITAIGKDSNGASAGTSVSVAVQQGTVTEIKAKKFIFGDRSNLTSINGTLKLNTKEDDKLEIKGKVILKGTSTAEAKLEVVKNGSAAGGGAAAGAGGSANGNVHLKLHDIQSTGKGSITNKGGIEFVDSHIEVIGMGSAKSLVLTDETVNLIELQPPMLASAKAKAPLKNQMSGTIASITLKGGDLEFKRKSANSMGAMSLLNPNGATTAGINLNAGGTITTSGDSKLIVKSIKVGKQQGDKYSLKVLDGTFTLIEEETTQQIGDIVLGSDVSDENKKIKGGNFVFISKQQNGTNQLLTNDTTSYNDLKLQGNLTSFGDSSLTIKQWIAIQDSESKNYTISSKGGVLTFNLMANSDVEFKNHFVLENGGLKFNNHSSQITRKVSFKNSSIVAKGDSGISAQELDLGGASIDAKAGVLRIQGVKTTTSAGNVNIGNAGVLRIQNSVGTKASLSIQDQSVVTLSANAPFVSPENPLGGGSFGKIEVGSLTFEGGNGGKKLVNIALTGEASNASTLKDDRLFALREGEIILIDTDNGIKKKTGNAKYENLTLNDIGVDPGSYTSITLTPILKNGKTFLEEEIVKQLVLGVSVSQKTLPQILESIQDPNQREIMKNIFSNPLNTAIAESILNSQDNVFKVGMHEYISSGNVDVVLSTLQTVLNAFQASTDSIYASDKIAQEIKMLRVANLENQMARSGNPYVSKSELAHLMKAISGTRYASSDDELLLDEEYTGRNYGSLWATYEGATSFGTLDSASVNGLSAGYDTLVGEMKEYLLGFYVNYDYGIYSANFVKNSSHNFGLGFYSRMTFEQNEVDLVVSQSVGINQSDLTLGPSQSLATQYLNQRLKYNFFITNAQVSYGYLLQVGEKESPFYFKPFGGIDFGVTINTQTQGDGQAPIYLEHATNFKLSVLLGLEMKKYFNEGSHIYILPVLEKGLVNDGGAVNLGFKGVPTIPYAQYHQVKTALALYAGGSGFVGKNTSITGGVGIKIDVEQKDILTNWNVGFKYKF